MLSNLRPARQTKAPRKLEKNNIFFFVSKLLVTQQEIEKRPVKSTSVRIKSTSRHTRGDPRDKQFYHSDKVEDIRAYRRNLPALGPGPIILTFHYSRAKGNETASVEREKKIFQGQELSSISLGEKNISTSCKTRDCN